MILLHVCCGPCAVYPALKLKEMGPGFDACFYNPNIHPREEYEKRKENTVIWAENEGVLLHTIDDMFTGPWHKQYTQKKDRCAMCYDLRIGKVFDFAKDKGYESVTSTLLVSPYQDHELIIQIFKKHEERTGISFIYVDFRKGYRQGQAQAAKTGLYRQKYCGCLPSIKESAYMQKKIQKR